MGLELLRTAPERAVASPREDAINTAAAAAYQPRVAGEPITDLSGKQCKAQPRNGEFPILGIGAKNNGCAYDKSVPSEMPPLNTAALYQQAIEQTVKLGVTFSKGFATGSGVMVGKGDGVCYVATDNHNIGGEKGDKFKSVETKFFGGKRYPASVAVREPENDIALLAVKTGADTAAVCKPAVVAADPTSYRGEGATFGFPKEARTLYASPTTYLGVERLQDLMRTRGPRGGVVQYAEGENPKRDVLTTKSRTHQGNSGGPMYNNLGEVVALLGGGVPNDPTVSYGNVLTRATVNRWLERVKRSK